MSKKAEKRLARLKERLVSQQQGRFMLDSFDRDMRAFSKMLKIFGLGGRSK